AWVKSDGTDNGIGWFRSDELTSADVNDRIERGEPMNVFEELAKSANQLKTRRILEIQSDLFQKGRDEGDLITNYKKAAEKINFEDGFEFNGNFYIREKNSFYVKENGIEISNAK